MNTHAEFITEAILALLKDEPELVDGNVWRSRLRPIPAGSNFAIVVRQGRDLRINESTTIGNYSRQAAVLVEIYARGDVPDQLADPIVHEVVKRVMVDTNLGGLSDDILVGNKQPDWSARDTDLVAIDLEFIVTYQLPTNEL